MNFLEEYFLKSRDTHRLILMNGELYQSALPAWLTFQKTDHEIYLHIADGTHVQKPLYLLHIQTQVHSPSTKIKQKISIGKQSVATIVEEYTYHDVTAYENKIDTEIHLGENAMTDYYYFQNEQSDAIHLSRIEILPKRDSAINLYSIALGGKISQQQVYFSFRELNARAHLFALYHGREKQQVDLRTQVDHFAERCESKQTCQGVMMDQARGLFDGKIVVHPLAHKTHAHLSNKNLLLSKQAEINTNPALEIYADDVQCSHGATVGCLDEDALFYLQSRGVTPEKAKQLLTQAFVNEVLEIIPDDHIRFYIQSAVSQHEHSI